MPRRPASISDHVRRALGGDQPSRSTREGQEQGPPTDQSLVEESGGGQAVTLQGGRSFRRTGKT